MSNRNFSVLIILIIGGVFLISCQKEIDGTINSGINPTPANMKPKLGTVWTYHYYTYYSTPGGGIATISVLTYKAKTEEILGGEKWLNIVDSTADTTVFLLNIKTAGLYQYTNNNSYLFCKDPAAVNDTYSTYNSGGPENFIVKEVKDTIPTGIGNVPANYYEGSRGAYVFDQVWYNENAWIVRKQVYRVNPIAGLYYRYSTLFIDNIVY